MTFPANQIQSTQHLGGVKMYSDKKSEMNKTLIASATELGAMVVTVGEDAIHAVFPKMMTSLELVQATHLLVRSVPHAQVMRCDKTSNGIELDIQIS